MKVNSMLGLDAIHKEISMYFTCTSLSLCLCLWRKHLVTGIP